MAAPELGELNRCLATLEALGRDPGPLARAPQELKIALAAAAAKVALPGKIDRLRLKKARRLEQKRQDEASDRAVRAASDIRVARLSPVYVPPARVECGGAERASAGELKKPRYCYVCKAPFTRLHFFYDSMCGPCGEFNYAKRFQSASLEGRVAVITGARLKIGYQASLMMLRAGARVVATTRFPHDAALRYSREPDFVAWRGRLSLHGLDLRHSPSVEIFARYLDSTLDRLDILVNNAAQTVRRPPAFYAHLLEREAAPASELSGEQRALLRGHEECKAALSAPAAPIKEAGADATGLTVWQAGMPQWSVPAAVPPKAGHAGGPGVGLRESARLSQIKYSFDDAELGRDAFPDGRTDADLQQVDLRSRNSWRMTLAEVPAAEMIELQLINAVAPFILCGRLKPLMRRRRTGEKHIVNVSAMEGSFSRHTKTDKHPHTNMAKAALNMMTLTSAPDYAKEGIHMNAVDTGWVTDEDPAVFASRKKDELDFQPPLDIVDGAARVCDPFFSGLLSGSHLWGKFLKDYKPTDW